jgi:hypothetical protein
VEPNDEISSKLRVCVEGAVSDLHAADARFHVSCMSSFMVPRSVSVAKNASQVLSGLSAGLSSIVVFKSNAKALLHLSSDIEDDQQSLLIENLAKTTVTK